MASVISLLYYVYQTGIAAQNFYSFMTFIDVMYPYIKHYGDKIPYDDLETIYKQMLIVCEKKYNLIITDNDSYLNKFRQDFKNVKNKYYTNTSFEDNDDPYTWIDMSTHTKIQLNS